MSTTMYLRNRREIAAAAKAAQALGYTNVTQADIRNNDRYVINIVARLASLDRAEQRELEQAIVNAVSYERQ